MARYQFMSDPCVYRNNINLFAFYVYWTSFPLVMVSFAGFHFATLVLSLVDISFVVFGDCYRLFPKAYSSVYGFRFTDLLCFFWNERILLENNSYFFIVLYVFAVRSQDYWNWSLCVEFRLYFCVQNCWLRWIKSRRGLPRTLLTMKRRIEEHWVVKIAFKSFWPPCSTVMYLKRDSLAQTLCINCTEEGQLLR